MGAGTGPGSVGSGMGAGTGPGGGVGTPLGGGGPGGRGMSSTFANWGSIPSGVGSPSGCWGGVSPGCGWSGSTLGRGSPLGVMLGSGSPSPVRGIGWGSALALFLCLLFLWLLGLGILLWFRVLFRLQLPCLLFFLPLLGRGTHWSCALVGVEPRAAFRTSSPSHLGGRHLPPGWRNPLGRLFSCIAPLCVLPLSG